MNATAAYDFWQFGAGGSEVLVRDGTVVMHQETDSDHGFSILRGYTVSQSGTAFTPYAAGQDNSAQALGAIAISGETDTPQVVGEVPRAVDTSNLPNNTQMGNSLTA